LSNNPCFLRVDRKYITQLRIDVSINWGILLCLTLLAAWLLPVEWPWLPLTASILSVAMLVIWIVLASLWAPRRYRLTGYQVQSLDVHYRTGALWRTQTAVPINRIQHVEITQGPVERMLGLAKLVLYTAGGSGSDLAIPGLLKTDAESLRQTLLASIEDTTPAQGGPASATDSSDPAT
jgi:uncharacterized protein